MIVLEAVAKKRSRALINADSNRLESADRPAHDWYRFILSFPPHLVRDYVERFSLAPGTTVLDPFCGTGTTPVECKKLGLRGIGIEAHPMSYFASSTKLDWRPDPDILERIALGVAEEALSVLECQGIIDDPQPSLLRDAPVSCELESLPAEELKLLLAHSISPLPLHKSLILLRCIDRASFGVAHMRLALAKALVTSIGNLHFGPEVGLGLIKPDVPVVSALFFAPALSWPTWLAIRLPIFAS